MAVRYWGVNKGGTATSVVEGASTNSTDVEITLDLSKSLTRLELFLAINYIIQKMIKDNWPPA